MVKRHGEIISDIVLCFSFGYTESSHFKCNNRYHVVQLLEFKHFLKISIVVHNFLTCTRRVLEPSYTKIKESYKTINRKCNVLLSHKNVKTEFYERGTHVYNTQPIFPLKIKLHCLILLIFQVLFVEKAFLGVKCDVCDVT